jgi:hypothetical protein
MEETFVEKLIKSIVNNRNMPKVQVEREFSPILEIFIESAMNELAKKEVIWEGEYRLIATEFPLHNQYPLEREKRGNDGQSVNIDFLLLNRTRNFWVFVELKTDSTSFKPSQYHHYKDKVIDRRDIKNKGELLYDFLKCLPDWSDKKYKYDKYIEKIEERLTACGLKDFSTLNDIKLIYIAPKELTKENPHRGYKGKKAIESLTTNSENEKFITFEDLKNHNNIEHEFKSEWKTITEQLIALDYKDETKIL